MQPIALFTKPIWPGPNPYPTPSTVRTKFGFVNGTKVGPGHDTVQEPRSDKIWYGTKTRYINAHCPIGPD